MSRPYHDGTAPAAALTTIFTATDTYCADGEYRYMRTSCMPPNWTQYWAGDIKYYSPAICPSGYSSAGFPAPGFGPNFEGGETAVVCCPPEYAYVPSRTSYCIGSVTTESSTITNVVGTTAVAGGTTVVSVRTILDSSSAYAIQIRYAQSDLSLFETDPTRPGETPQPGGGNPDTPGSPENPSGGLSGGAKIGIGVGVGLGALVLLILAVFLVLRRNKRRKGVAGDASHEAHAHYAAPVGGLAGTEKNYGGASNSSAVFTPPEGYTYNPNANDSSTWGGGLTPQQGPQDNPAAHEELQRIQQRRERLLELERLAQDEDRIRSGLSVQAELPATEVTPVRHEAPDR